MNAVDYLLEAKKTTDRIKGKKKNGGTIRSVEGVRNESELVSSPRGKNSLPGDEELSMSLTSKHL